MRKLRLLAVIIVLAVGVMTQLTASAQEDYSYLGLDELEDSVPESASQVMGDVEIDGDLDTGSLIKDILDSAANALWGIVKEAAGGAVTVLAAAALCSIVSGIAPPGTTLGNAITLAGVAVISAASISGVGSLISIVSETMNETNAFSKSLLPVLASASAITGAAASAAAKYAVATMFLDLLVTVGERVVLPLIYMYLAASIASSAFGGGLSGAVKFISKAVKFMLTAIAIAFTLFLTISGLITSSADAAAVKVTQTAISALLPVVGGMVSDAADAVASGVSVIKSAAGAFGVLTVCAMCIIPFLRLAVNCAAYRIASALAEPVADSRLAGLIDSVSNVCGMALGLSGTCTIILLISVISVTRAVTGI